MYVIYHLVDSHDLYDKIDALKNGENMKFMHVFNNKI